MNKFDITELPKQWLVALVALAFTFLLVVPGCAGEAADNGGNGENAAAGWDVQVEDSDYGKFVTSINGIANGSEGEASGWVYTVNDETVMEACDVRQLAAGDSVQWSFYVG